MKRNLRERIIIWLAADMPIMINMRIDDRIDGPVLDQSGGKARISGRYRNDRGVIANCEFIFVSSRPLGSGYVHANIQN